VADIFLHIGCVLEYDRRRLFGFMINPPIALYYMQGLNTTPVHAHAALFGVYGMLGIGLMLFCLRVMWVQKKWKEKMLKFSFWSLNIGLLAMVVGSLLPVGLMQTWASVKYDIVCTKLGISSFIDGRNYKVVENLWRYDLCSWRTCTCLVCLWTGNRAFSEERKYKINYRFSF